MDPLLTLAFVFLSTVFHGVEAVPNRIVLPGVGVGAATGFQGGAATGLNVLVPPASVPAVPSAALSSVQNGAVVQSLLQAASSAVSHVSSVSTPTVAASVASPSVALPLPASGPAVIPSAAILSAAIPSAVAPTLPANVLNSSAVPSANVPTVVPAHSTPSVDTPFLSDSLGSASVLQITIPSGAAVPAGLPTSALSVPATSLPPEASAPPITLPTPSVTEALESLGEEIVSSLASALAQLTDLLDLDGTAPNSLSNVSAPSQLSAAPIGAAAIPTNLPSAAQPGGALGVQTGLGGAAGTVVQPPNVVPTTTGSVGNGIVGAAPTASLPMPAGGESVIRRLAVAQLPSLNGLGGSLPAAALPSVPNGLPAIPSAAGSLPNGQASLPAAGLPSLPTSALPLQVPTAVTGAINSGSLPGSPGTAAENVVASVPIPSNMPAIVQGLKNAAVAPLTDVPGLGQAQQALALLNVLGMMNVGQFGSLATVTNIPALQSAVLLINEPDLITVIYVLESKSLLQSTAADGLLSNVVAVVQLVEMMAPLVSNIQAAMAYVFLTNLGLTGLQDVLDGTLLQDLP